MHEKGLFFDSLGQAQLLLWEYNVVAGRYTYGAVITTHDNNSDIVLGKNDGNRITPLPISEMPAAFATLIQILATRLENDRLASDADEPIH